MAVGKEGVKKKILLEEEIQALDARGNSVANCEELSEG